MEPDQPFSAKDFLDPYTYKLYKRHYEIDFRDDTWDIRPTVDKPGVYIIPIMAIVGLLQLASHRVIFGTVSLICAFLAIFAFQGSMKRFNLLNTGIDKLTITPNGITEYLDGKNGTRQYNTNQVQFIYTTSEPSGNKYLISIILRDVFGAEHAIVTFLSKDEEDQKELAGNLATAIKNHIGYKGV